MRRAETLLERVDLNDRLDAKVRTLSGGQARRAEIARALIHRPRLLLCDEATAGLDIQSRRDIVDHVHTLTDETGVGVLWATHLTDEISPNDQVIVLHKGRILASGDVREIAGGSALDEAFIAMTREAA